MNISIDINQCMGCGNCTNFCPKKLLQLTDDTKHNTRNVCYVEITNESECLHCGTCELMCTAGAIRVNSGNAGGSELIDKKKIPPHSGCYLGSLSKALADAIFELKIQHEVVVFKRAASDVNIAVETHDYADIQNVENQQYYEDGLQYKMEHPEKIVIIINGSSKVHTSAINEARYRQLTSEKVTFINTLNYFEANADFTSLEAGGSHIIEELGNHSTASFIARGSVRTPQQMRQLKGMLKKALLNQMNQKNYAVVEMVFPCFYRLTGRPQTLMPAEKIRQVNEWFDRCVCYDYENKIYKEE